MSVYITTKLFLSSILHTFSLWDTAGQEDLESIRVLAYDKTDILLVSFSIVDQGNYYNVKTEWYPEIQKYKEKFKDALVSGHF